VASLSKGFPKNTKQKYLFLRSGFRRVFRPLMTGLPPENPMEPNITATRGAIKRLISQHHPEHGLFDPPVHVRITGSLFWDGEHANQHVGPEGLQPDTAWEIHPIKDLTVLSN
jgi:hypothetical protein